MKTIAIGGLLYQIQKFFNETVDHYELGILGQTRTLKEISRKIEEYRKTGHNIRLIGFSRGATFALRLSADHKISEIYAHSPGKITEREISIANTNFITLFRTIGDRMGNVYNETNETYQRLKFWRDRSFDLITRFKLIDLEFSEIPEPNGFTERKMNKRHHVFHNCLEHLPIGIRSGPVAFSTGSSAESGSELA